MSAQCDASSWIVFRIWSIREFLQAIPQNLEPGQVPVVHRVFPAVPEGFSTEPGQLAQPSQVIAKLENRAAIVSAFGDDGPDLVDAVIHG